MFRARAVLLLGCVGWAACSNSVSPDGTERGISALRPVGSCRSLEDELKAQAIADMNRRIDEAIAQQSGSSYCWREGDFFTNAGSQAPTSAPSSQGGASQYSTTNNQVAGVDEADFVKNDARYLYVLADGKLQIVDAWPAAQSHVVSRTSIEGTPKKLFVHQGRAIVYSSLENGTQSSGYFGYRNTECTYGYDCEFGGDGKALKITILDLTQVAAPTPVRELVFSGSHLASRRIGDAIHTVITFPDVIIPGVKTWPDGLDYCDDSTSPSARVARFEALRHQNIEAISAATLADFMPSTIDRLHTPEGVATETNLLESCDNFYLSRQMDGRALMTVVSFEANGTGRLSATTVVGRPGALYASEGSLYVASRHAFQEGMGWFFADGKASDEATTVHKFALSAQPPSSAYVGSGVVKGHVLNQFSMDEEGGNLRIATSLGRVPNPDVTSSITVLAQTPESLEVIGSIDGIAPHEDIRSVRFEGKRGFIVTFKKTDPLFALDLSDPRHPFIAGELHIPGFSTYLHLMDDEHLLSIGFDAEDHGSFAYFQGLQLQIFDVSNLAAPTLTHKTVIGTRGSTSEAATNHLAFNYFAPKGLLALPMAVCENSSGGSSYGQLTFGGLMVYDVSAASGFHYRGGVAHDAPETNGTYYNACGNWWSQGTTVVKRSVFMDDFVYSIAEDVIRVDSIHALGTDVAVVSLKSP